MLKEQDEHGHSKFYAIQNLHSIDMLNVKTLPYLEFSIIKKKK